MGLAGGRLGYGLAQSAGAAAVPAAWWYVAGNPVAAYQPKGASSLAASYLRIAGSGVYANIDPAVVGGVAPTFDAATGWTFNGSNTRLDTGITPDNNQAWSIIIRFSGRTNSSTPLSVAGNTVSYPRFGFYLDGSNVYYYNGALASKAGNVTAGVLAVAGTKCYRNGADEGLTLGAKAGAFVGSLPLGCRRLTAVGFDLYYAGAMQAVAVYSDTLTAPQVAAISSAMAAL